MKIVTEPAIETMVYTYTKKNKKNNEATMLSRDATLQDSLITFVKITNGREANLALANLTLLIQNHELANSVMENIVRPPETQRQKKPASIGFRDSKSILREIKPTKAAKQEDNIQYLNACILINKEQANSEDIIQAYHLLKPLIDKDHSYALYLAAKIVPMLPEAELSRDRKELQAAYEQRALDLKNPLVIYDLFKKQVYNFNNKEIYIDMARAFQEIPENLQNECLSLLENLKTNLAFSESLHSTTPDDMSTMIRLALYMQMLTFHQTRLETVTNHEQRKAITEEMVAISARIIDTYGERSVDDKHTNNEIKTCISDRQNYIADHLQDLTPNEQKKLLQKCEDSMATANNLLDESKKVALPQQSFANLLQLFIELTKAKQEAMVDSRLSQYLKKYNEHSFTGRSVALEKNKAKYNNLDRHTTAMMKEIDTECRNRLDSISRLVQAMQHHYNELASNYINNHPADSKDPFMPHELNSIYSLLSRMNVLESILSAPDNSVKNLQRLHEHVTAVLNEVQDLPTDEKTLMTHILQACNDSNHIENLFKNLSNNQQSTVVNDTNPSHRPQ